MTVEARWNGVVIAASDKTVLVEGNHYFPPDDVLARFLEESESASHCTWKGDASYYDVVVEGQRNVDAAWYYPTPLDAASPMKNYIAFWHGVETVGANPGEPEILPPRS